MKTPFSVLSGTTKTSRALLAALTSVSSLSSIFAEDVHWITGQGDNSDIALRYGTASTPLSWFDTTKWFTDDPRPNSGAQTPNNAIPVDGQSVAHSNSCCNPEPFVTIDNNGNGVNLPTSAIRFDAKTNLFDSGAGDLTNVAGGSYDFDLVDDALIADTIAFNGAGGASNDVYVPVIANTFTSNRHGAVFNAPITVDTILAQSGHQDRWVINASPTAEITYILLNENRGPDGGDINGFFATNVDMEVATLDHVWSRLRVDDAEATLSVGTYNYTFYTNQGTNNGINPLVLTGNMEVGVFNMIDIVDGTPVRQPDGTWGAVGSGADNEVDWITGAGILTVGTGSNRFFFDVESSGTDLVFTWDSQSGKVYDLLSSVDPEADGNPETWTIFDEREGIPATPDTNMLTIARPADDLRLFVILERDAPPPPPVFFDDFESVPNPDWTTGANPGDVGNTVWERGAPTADLGSLGASGPATGANGSATCFGTNLTAIYGSDTDIYLRSPAIDLTAFNGGNTATLTLEYYIDTDLAFVDPDVGRIRVLNANNLGEQLGTDVTDADGLGAIGTDWITFSEPLPTEALGETIVLEFQFTSNSDAENFGGFYIDEVMVEIE